MKPLSEALLDLAGRVQTLETSTKADYERDRADLEKSLEELGASVDAGVREFEAAVREADAQGSTWWDESRASIARQLEDDRDRYRQEAQHEFDEAKPTGDVAEVDAKAAVALANYAVTAAQYSIADAALKDVTADRPKAPESTTKS